MTVMSYRLIHAVEIGAAPELVWRVLTDFAGYSRWAGFKGELSGTPRVGGLIKVTARPRRGKVMITYFRITTCTAPGLLSWNAMYAPFWGLSGTRFFSIEPLAGGRRSRVTTGEEYRGWLLPWLRGKFDAQGADGIRRLCEGLRVYCEGQVSA